MKSVAKDGDWIRRTISGAEPDVSSVDVPEDQELSNLIDSTPEAHYVGMVDGSRAVSEPMEFLCDARQECLASRSGFPRN